MEQFEMGCPERETVLQTHQHTGIVHSMQMVPLPLPLPASSTSIDLHYHSLRLIITMGFLLIPKQVCTRCVVEILYADEEELQYLSA